MIEILVAAELVESGFTSGNTIRASIVRAGLPPGSKLVEARVERRGLGDDALVLHLWFEAPGSEGRKVSLNPLIENL